MYQFSDYPWPASVSEEFPTQQEVLDYFHSYAKHFQLMQHINFCSRVKGISYDGPSSDSWVLWNGTGEPFPPGGKWNITVENTKTATTQVYTVDFVILSRGKVLMVISDESGPEHPCFFLSVVATLTSPMRWTLMKLMESHTKITLPLAKYDMVPKHGLGHDMASGLIMHLPDPHDFFDALKKGISTGYDGVEKVKNIFESPTFGHYISDSPRVGLYRECIHPRIPQLGIIGFSDGLSSLYTSEMRCKWLAAVLEGSVKLPNINEMQNNIKEWDEYMEQALGHHQHRSFLGSIEIWHSDVLCKDMGVNPIRKKGLYANMFEAYGPADYADI
nr:probable flavin-containing monooxygenase 1 [Tanacetum cinerariifolium]